MILFIGLDFKTTLLFKTIRFIRSLVFLYFVSDANSDASLAYWSRDTNKIQISPIIRQRKGKLKYKWVCKMYCNVFTELCMYILA